MTKIASATARATRDRGWPVRWSGTGAGVLIVAVSCLATPRPVAGQSPEYNLWNIRETRLAAPHREGMPQYRGGFTFCRLQYTSVRTEAAGLGWSTDYPGGDQNFMVRLSQLTETHISHWDDWTPGHAVVRATDPNLFRCPFLFTSDVGTVGFSEAEVQALREYFKKGGFLWVDDFWGDRAWEQWSREIGRVLPEYDIVDLTSAEHPIFSLIYRIEEVPQIPNIGFWRRTGGETSERGAETATAHLRAIFDDDDRLLVVMTHNTDIADAWEREGESDEFFQLFSPVAYGLGVNIAVWVMTRR